MKKLFFAIFITATIAGKAQLAGVLGQIIQSTSNNKFDGVPILGKNDFLLDIKIGTPNNVANKLNVSNILGGTLGGLLGIKDETSNKVGPIIVSGEYFTSGHLSFGLSALYASGARKVTSGSTVLLDDALRVTQFTGFSCYHLGITDKIDPYIKGGIGINLWKSKKDNSKGLPEPLNYNGILGIRYFVSPNFALNAEAGINSLNFSGNIGLSFKLTKPKAKETKN